jgi:hypothetical protein
LAFVAACDLRMSNVRSEGRAPLLRASVSTALLALDPVRSGHIGNS